MIKITPAKTNHVDKKTPLRKKDETSSAFSVPTETTTTGIFNDDNATKALSNTEMISCLMDLQEVSGRQTPHHKLTQHGENLLDELDQLRSDLLQGSLSRQKLQTLAEKLTTNRPLFDTSELSHVVREIEQRVAVELAKLKMTEKNVRL